MKTPRILLTAAASGSGKTLITCGILQLLKNKGLSVTAFKCGPDYIDPMFHSRVIGAKSRNLDTFFTDRETTRYLMQKNAEQSDIAVIEGVMGYYDGLAGTSTQASAWDVADATNTPAVLIVNCKGMSVSVIPFIKGFLEYQENSHIKGVILNRLSPMMYPRLKEKIESELPVKVYGYLPSLPDQVLESRHLGLIMPTEIQDLQVQLQQLATVMQESVDIEGLLQLAATADALEAKDPQVADTFKRAAKETVRIAVARDEAFCFFYQDNLTLLEEMGAELVDFSPLHDHQLPDNIQGLMINGGYPELYAKQLSENYEMRQAIHQAIADGVVCLAECGGFMYLHEEMENMDGQAYPMVGIIKGKSYKTEKLSRFGYITLSAATVFGDEIDNINAHEFHYFDSTNCGTAMLAKKPLSKRSWSCGHSTETLFAGFPHLYFYHNPQVAVSYLNKCIERKQKDEFTRNASSN